VTQKPTSPKPAKLKTEKPGASGAAGLVALPIEVPEGLQLNAARPAAERSELLLWMHQQVTAEYGPRPLTARRSPMHELISTILSQRTDWRNEEIAYQELRALGGGEPGEGEDVDWDKIASLPVEVLAHAIRASTYPEQKAPRIQATLKAICASRGNYDLTFLAEMEPDAGLKWLTALPGVGVKTSSLVLLFNFAKPVFPVDTHVHRITSRVGAIPRMGEATAHKALLALLPPDPPLLYELHVNLLRHGQQVCSFSDPKCGRCVLRDRCDAYALFGDDVPTFTKG
jgi:endonuclease III